MAKQPERPKLLVIAGPNGSGKTSVTSKLLRHEWIDGCEYVNPDFIARDVYGDWNSPEAVMAAAREASARRERCIVEGRSLIFETVMSAPDKVDFITKARACGYFVRLFFIGTDSPSINAARVADRIMSGGHGVPMEKIISRYYKTIINCAKLVPVVDRLYVYDNSVDGEFAKLMFRTVDGKLMRQYTEPHPWAREIFEAISGEDEIPSS
ncbi:MAG: zeta toxin family protein [Tannerellaceae bacterium]|jgi:predicted ABC-type ATPase|nr:zeta toxin family protein [Tannerellaceae bacterium]